MDAPESQVMIRTSTPPYVAFGGIGGAVFLLNVFVAVTKDPSAWKGAAAMVVFFAAILSWLATTRLTLTSDAIHYRSLLVAKDIALSAISNAEFVTGFHSTKPYKRLVVTVRDTEGEKEITLNLGLFGPSDVKRWMDALKERL